jgi:hypothetical protein
MKKKVRVDILLRPEVRDDWLRADFHETLLRQILYGTFMQYVMNMRRTLFPPRLCHKLTDG